MLPTFVTVTLRGSAGALGLIEGLSDALTGLLKLLGGPLANDPTRRLRMASGGYLVTAAATGALGLAATVWQAGLLRATAWAARGIRSPARDALLASLATPATYGRAFGLERAGDNLGAVVGPLAAAALVSALGVRSVLYVSAVPGALAALAIVAAAREARKLGDPRRRPFRLDLRGLRDAGLARPLLPVGAFELGNMAATLLLLRATSLLHADGRTLTAATSLAILAYAGHNLCAAVLAYAGGHWLDRAGPRVVFGSGAALYVAAYSLFALSAGGLPLVAGAFVLAGSGIGLAETAESALVARVLPDRLRGSGFGVLGGVQSLGDFASSATVGLLWAAVSPAAGFAYAAACMAASLSATLASGWEPGA